MVRDLNTRIKKLREERGVSQTLLAEILGVTKASVNGWEMNVSAPSLTNIIKIARLFGVSTDYLLGTARQRTIDVSELDENEISLIMSMLNYIKGKRVK